MSTGLDNKITDDWNHLSYEQMEIYVNGETSAIDKEIVEGHLSVCVLCAEEVSDLALFRQQLHSLTQTPTHTASPPLLPRSKTGLFGSLLTLFAPPKHWGWVGAACAVGLVGAGLVTRRLWQPTAEQASVLGVSDGSRMTEEVSSKPERISASPPVTPKKPSVSVATHPPKATPGEQPQRPAHVAVVKDKPGKLVHPKQKAVVLLSARLGHALQAGAIVPNLSRLATQTSMERGLPSAPDTPETEPATSPNASLPTPNPTAPPTVAPNLPSTVPSPEPNLTEPIKAVPFFALQHPVATRVFTSRPRFEWQNCSGAAFYEVFIADTQDSQLDRHRTQGQTRWTASKPLPEGQVLIWEVHAYNAQNERIAYTHMARFEILTGTERANLSRNLKRLANEAKQQRFAPARVSLLRAALFAQMGLRDEAVREAQQVAQAVSKTSPLQTQAQRLLEALQTEQKLGKNREP